MAKQVRAARHYQRDDDPVLRLARSAMRSVARELKHAFENLSSMVPQKQVADAIRSGRNPSGLINWNHYREVLRGAFDRLGKLRHSGGALGARKINGVFASKRRKVRFRKAGHAHFTVEGAVVGASRFRLAQKASKAEAGYVDRSTHGDERCSGCWMFQAVWQCCSVEGVINPMGWCTFYEPVLVAKASLEEEFEKQAKEMIAVGLLRPYQKATGDQFNFDSFSPAIAAAIRAEQDRLIQQLEQNARDTIDAIINSGIADGTSVEDMAADIADNIGLTEIQWNAVDNYRSMLEDLDPQALARQLRNTDYDALYQDAIDAQSDLSEAAVEEMVQSYIENYIDYRAATISQTESTRAANLGLHDAYGQAIDRGALTDDAITRYWQLGDNPCPVCESIVDNNPNGVGVDESFDSIEGPVDDPPVHPNCECSVDYVTDLSQVPDDSEEDIGPGSFGPGGVNTPYMDDSGEE